MRAIAFMKTNNRFALYDKKSCTITAYEGKVILAVYGYDKDSDMPLAEALEWARTQNYKDKA